jgi:tRNA(Ile)-lysidine synthase
MALAALYATARRSNKLLPEAHGFIVDHKARPESTEEAEWVAEQLRQKCMLVYHL